VARHGPNAHRVDRAGSQSGHIEPQARRFCAMPRTKCVPRRMHRISIRPHRARGQAFSLTVGFSLGSFSCLRGLLLGLVWERLAGSFWEPVRGGSGVPSGTFLEHAWMGTHNANSPQKKGLPLTQHNDANHIVLESLTLCGSRHCVVLEGRRLRRLSRAAGRKASAHYGEGTGAGPGVAGSPSKSLCRRCPRAPGPRVNCCRRHKPRRPDPTPGLPFSTPPSFPPPFRFLADLGGKAKVPIIPTFHICFYMFWHRF